MARSKGSKGFKTEKHRVSVLEEIRARRKKTPLEFLLRVMWNRRRPLDARIEAAKAAAPYVHRKMPLELEHSGEIEIIPPSLPSREELNNGMG